MVGQVDFYVLDGADDDARLRCACRIAAKGYQRGMRVYLRTETALQAETLDRLLWSFQPTSFIPHRLRTGDSDNIETDGQTRVLIGESDPPEGWNQLLVSLTETVPACAGQFERIADLISGGEPERAAGRERFRWYRQTGVEPITHRIQL